MIGMKIAYSKLRLLRK